MEKKTNIVWPTPYTQLAKTARCIWEISFLICPVFRISILYLLRMKFHFIVDQISQYRSILLAKTAILSSQNFLVRMLIPKRFAKSAALASPVEANRLL